MYTVTQYVSVNVYCNSTQVLTYTVTQYASVNVHFRNNTQYLTHNC